MPSVWTDKLMEAAREEEREACARYVDDYRERYGGDWPALEWIAAGIRARNQGGNDTLRAQNAELVAALEQSVKLQSHYAELLNMYDGGQRLMFANVEAWLDRLAALAKAKGSGK